MMTKELSFLPPREEMERAFRDRDPRGDGRFFLGRWATGRFCRPTCDVAHRASPDQGEFFGTIREAIEAGYQPCEACRPLVIPGAPSWLPRLLAMVDQDKDLRADPAHFQTLRVSAEEARRWFLRHYGLTFVEWWRAARLAKTFTTVRADETLSTELSQRVDEQASLKTALIETPVGGFLAVANEAGIVAFEFTDRSILDSRLDALSREFRAPVRWGEHPHLDQARTEIAEYFAGERREFTVPLAPPGTPFQKRVWDELCRIPYGETRSYEAQADALGQRAAIRAVAQANGNNRIAILIPCHRVIGKDGSLTGFGGGMWRKRLLLILERTGELPR